MSKPTIAPPATIAIDRLEGIDLATIRDGELALVASAAVKLQHKAVAFRFTIEGVAETALVVLDRSAGRAAVAWGGRYGELDLQHADTPDSVFLRFARQA
jgi:hypothetical protein